MWGTHAEYSVNTQEHMQIHDTQLEKRENMLETPADKKPNRASFSYRILAWNSQGNDDLNSRGRNHLGSECCIGWGTGTN